MGFKYTVTERKMLVKGGGREIRQVAKQSVGYLTMGFSVRLGDLGTLTPRISAKAVPTEEKYTTDNIRRVNVRYTPSSAIKTRLKGVSYERWDPREDAKCPDPSVHTGKEPGKETGGSEIN